MEPAPGPASHPASANDFGAVGVLRCCFFRFFGLIYFSQVNWKGYASLAFVRSL